MAKRKKKRRSSAKNNLKFEVYGIVILILAVVALAGQGGGLPGLGTVGHALSSLCIFAAGKMYFVIPLWFIYLGLYVMIKRQWPRGWSYRKSGMLLLVLALSVYFQIHLFTLKGPPGSFSAADILRDPWDNFVAYDFGKQLSLSQYEQGLGGGEIGAIGYGAAYFFFDQLGAKLIDLALFAIGLMLVTGWSYVEGGKRVRRYVQLFGRKIRREFGEMARLIRRRYRMQPGRSKPRRAAVAADFDEEDELLDELQEETHRPVPKREKKKSPIFDLLTREGIEPTEGLLPDEEQEDAPPFDVGEAAEVFRSEDLHQPGTEEANLPLIHDFVDQVQAEESFAASDDGRDRQQSAPVAEQAGGAAAEPKAQEPQDMQLDGLDNSPIKVEPPKEPYRLPPFHLLNKPQAQGKGAELQDVKANARKLEATMESFGVRAKVLQVVRGPSVTRYEIQPDIGVKVSRVVSLTDDIALALAAKDIRMEAPIPGKSAIGIEVPNPEISLVTMREVMESSAFHEASSRLSIVLGRDISGQAVVGNLARMPHLLVAGATGSGKSVCINGIITSILFKARPDEVKFLMIDPKMVELNVYNGIPHLLAPVVTDPRRASLALKKIVQEMEKRYELFSKSSTRNIEGYNELQIEKGEAPLPYVVVIVDELADLMMVAAKDVEDSICRLAQMARAAGIHLIIATQRPSVDVITGLIKANIPSRIAFGVSSQVDSRTILDMAGAEKLLGRGDMLFMPVGASKPVRLQGAFLSDHEVEAVVNFVRGQEQADYKEDLVPEVEEQGGEDPSDADELYDQAVQIVVEAKQASVSLLQRRMRIGYTRAARLIDAMEAAGVVGPYEGSKPREVLVSPDQFHNRISS